MSLAKKQGASLFYVASFDRDFGNVFLVEEASTIYSSGKGLLELINEILDLAKVEASKMELNVHEVDLQSIVSSMKRVGVSCRCF